MTEEKKGVKTCSRCGIEKEIDDFVKTKVGIGSFCEKCRKERKEERERKTKLAGVKVCKRCGLEKQLCEFSEGKRFRDGYNPLCYSCGRERREEVILERLAKNKKIELLGKKKCIRCLEEKAVGEFAKEKRLNNAYHGVCINCENKDAMKRYYDKKISREESKTITELAGVKDCKKCGVEKALCDFNKEKRTKDGYSSRCSSCLNTEKEERVISRAILKKERIEKLKLTGIKKCITCLKEKKKSKFSRNKRKDDGYYDVCKKCAKRREIKTSKKRREKLKGYRKEFKKIGIKQCIKCKEKKTLDLFHKSINSKDGYCHICNKCKGKDSSEYRSRPGAKAKRSKYHKNYRLRPEVKERMKKKRERPRAKLRRAISCLIWESLKVRKNDKNGKSTFKDILQYSFDDFLNHLESMFLSGMTWENYGNGPDRWSIDHVVPDSWFKYSCLSDKGFKQSFSLKNLQPMWFTDNCSKGNLFAGTKDNKIRKEDLDQDLDLVFK